jgi:hypothetical protein
MEQLHFILVERLASKCFLLLGSLLMPSAYLNNLSVMFIHLLGLSRTSGQCMYVGRQMRILGW